MQKRRKPQRQCIGCHESKDKNELVRVVKTPEEKYFLTERVEKMEEEHIFVIVRSV